MNNLATSKLPRHVLFAFFVLAPSLFGQGTNIAINSTVIQPSVKRFGINLGTLDTYDSGQMLQNLITSNPGFEAQIWNSTIQCAYGTATSCTDTNQYSGWPVNFWNGATFEVFYGAAAGRTGTVSTSTAPGYGAGVILNFSGSGTPPATGDYLVLHKKATGTPATIGWSPYTSGAGAVTTSTTDLPAGTQGTQTAALSAPTQNDFANLSYYFDSTNNHSFVQLNGTYQLQFKAKAKGGSNLAYVQVTRYGVGTYLGKQVTLTNAWKTYNLTFSAAESGSAVGTVSVSFGTYGASSFELDDVSLTPTSVDPTNPTIFRDAVVSTLRQLQPGLLRYWGANGQLGETLDNLLAPTFGRQLAGYSEYSFPNQQDYGLHDFFVLCQTLGAEPWFVVPITFSSTDASNLIQYLAGSSSTVYGAKRAALGQTAPWTQVFPKIHLEFGNEAWNGTFAGGNIETPAAYGGRAQSMFAAMRSNAAYVASNFDLVLGGQAGSPGRNSGIQTACNNNDSFDIAPYNMTDVDSYSTNELLFGSSFAEPEAFMSSSTSAAAEGLTPGEVYQTFQTIQSSSHPVPVSFYETNMSTLAGAITQQALNSYVSSLGAGLTVVDTMLQGLKQFGVVNQQLFALPQYEFTRSDGSSVYLWGAVVDMGVTNRKRPQFLAMQMANQALSSGATMLQTVHTGADPTWSQSMVNTVQFTGAHDLQSYAFSNGSNLSLIVFNLSRSSALPVTFSGSNAPTGTVQMQQLTSANPTDTNEASNVVTIVPTTLTSFSSAAGLSLPPYSMTVLTWSSTTSSQPPVISAVSPGSITTTTATITWTTDQGSTSQVEYGVTPSYGSLSSLNATLTNTHSVTLTGLTPGATYDFAAISTNSSGVSATSTSYTFTTPLSTPTISTVAVTATTASTATITWATDQASTSLVNYGPTTAYGSSSPLSSTLVTSHSVTLTGLTAGTTYNFDVVSTNSAGGSATSTNSTFSTSATANAPNASYVAFWGITSSGVTISWSTDVAATTSVAYGTTTSLGQTSPLQSALVTSHGVTLSGLSPSTTYYFVAQSTGSNGVTGYSTTYSFTTITSGTPTISSIVVVPQSGNTAQISWQTSVPTTSYVQFGTTTSYNRYSGQTALTTTPSPSMGYVPSGTIHYQLISTDNYGNQTISPDYTFVEP